MRICLFLLLLVSYASQASADIIYSTFGPGDSYLTTTSWIVRASPALDIAMPFTVLGSDYRFTSVDLAVNNVPPYQQSTLDILLMTDVSGLPGSVLETLTVFAPPNQNIVSAASTLFPTLLEGTTYWIATDSRPAFLGSWPWALPALTGPYAASNDYGASWAHRNNRLAAFRVNGTAVPEPGTLTLVGLGVVGLIAGMTRRRKSVS